MEKIDFKKDFKLLYKAPEKKAVFVDVPPFLYLMVDGAGDPNTAPEFPQSIETLYTAVYTIKFAAKKAGVGPEYAVAPLSGLWWCEGTAGFNMERRDFWRWTMMIAQPPHIERGMVDAPRFRNWCARAKTGCGTASGWRSWRRGPASRPCTSVRTARKAPRWPPYTNSRWQTDAPSEAATTKYISATRAGPPRKSSKPFCGSRCPDKTLVGREKMKKGNEMLKHIVFVKFKKSTAESDIATLEKGLAGLPPVIAEIKEFQFGRDVVRSERSYDLALIGTFENRDALERYRVHPDHQAVSKKIKEIAESVVVVDFEC